MMVFLNGWDIDLQALSGYTEDARLVEVPSSSLAYVVYGFDDIGVSTTAGSLAVYRGKANPELIFHPQHWMSVPDMYTVRCNSTGTILLVYLANSRDRMEKHALVNLAENTFAHVFIPSALYRCEFRQIDSTRFLIEPPGQSDSPPYDRSYILDASLLTWFEYHREGNLDVMLIPKSQRGLLPQERSGSWQVLWYKIYQIALGVTSPMRAEAVTKRVMQQVEHYGTMDPPVDLHTLVIDENAMLAEESKS